MLHSNAHLNTTYHHVHVHMCVRITCMSESSWGSWLSETPARPMQPRVYSKQLTLLCRCLNVKFTLHIAGCLVKTKPAGPCGSGYSHNCPHPHPIASLRPGCSQTAVWDRRFGWRHAGTHSMPSSARRTPAAAPRTYGSLCRRYSTEFAYLSRY